MSAAPQMRFLEHTADVGLEITADTLPDVFRTAAAGMFELLLGARQLRAVQRALASDERTLSLHADDVAQLLVDFLRELLYWHESAGVCAVQVDFDSLTEHQLEARAQCARYSRAPIREIKGVTYHQLQVRQEKRGWHARVIFDV